jgi:hypothetical protein
MTSPSSIRLLRPHVRSCTRHIIPAFVGASKWKTGENLKIFLKNLKVFEVFHSGSVIYNGFEMLILCLALPMYFVRQTGEKLDQIAVAVFGYLTGSGGEEGVFESGELENELVNRRVIGGL